MDSIGLVIILLGIMLGIYKIKEGLSKKIGSISITMIGLGLIIFVVGLFILEHMEDYVEAEVDPYYPVRTIRLYPVSEDTSEYIVRIDNNYTYVTRTYTGDKSYNINRESAKIMDSIICYINKNEQAKVEKKRIVYNYLGMTKSKYIFNFYIPQ